MIKFRKDSDKVILIYRGEDAESKWVYQELKSKGHVTISSAFHFTKNDLTTQFEEENFEDDVEFNLAIKDGAYYRFPKDTLNTENDIYIEESIKLERKLFVAERNINIFPKLDKLIGKTVYIGGNNENAIPEKAYRQLLKNFPSTYELDRYARARISSVVSAYVETNDDYEQKYQRYLNQKPSQKGGNPLKVFLEVDLIKYKGLLEKLTTMLGAPESAYNEKQWQEEILQIILLLYPKYIKVFKEAPVKDTYSKKDRSIDFLLVDANGNTDIIEIKKPFDQCIVTTRTYRDNYIPLRELSGTVMQIEKYIFYLNKWGIKGEEELTLKYKSELPSGFEIKITNPSGIIIMGRTKGLNKEQLADFEVIKRKYKNVIDIITYDDLLQRIKFMIDAVKSKSVIVASA